MPAPTTKTPQEMAREVLRIIDIDVQFERTVILTDGNNPGPRTFTHVVQPSQLAFACHQYQLVTGESVDADALESALPWLDTEEDL